jgi:hypothetical protein
MTDTAARDVIAHELRTVNGALDLADAILSALLAAPESARLDLAWRLCKTVKPPDFPTWRPIETAPKDGTLILASWAGSALHPIISRWLKNGQAWTHPFNKPVNSPTHWLPLPAPPGPHRRNE